MDDRRGQPLSLSQGVINRLDRQTGRGGRVTRKNILG